jgi:hypothetical protein
MIRFPFPIRLVPSDHPPPLLLLIFPPLDNFSANRIFETPVVEVSQNINKLALT